MFLSQQDLLKLGHISHDSSPGIFLYMSPTVFFFLLLRQSCSVEQTGVEHVIHRPLFTDFRIISMHPQAWVLNMISIKVFSAIHQ